MRVLNEIKDMKVLFKLLSRISMLTVAIKIYASHGEMMDGILLSKNWWAMLSGATAHDSNQMREEGKFF